MHDSQTYRRNAVDCLVAARDAREPHHKRLYLLMAHSWHSLARIDGATDELLSSWGMTVPVKPSGIILTFSNAVRPAERSVQEQAAPEALPAQ